MMSGYPERFRGDRGFERIPVLIQSVGRKGSCEILGGDRYKTQLGREWSQTFCMFVSVFILYLRPKGSNGGLYLCHLFLGGWSSAPLSCG